MTGKIHSERAPGALQPPTNAPERSGEVPRDKTPPNDAGVSTARIVPPAASSPHQAALQAPGGSAPTAASRLPKPANSVLLTLKDANLGAPVALQRGHSLILELEHDPGTGYEWQFGPNVPSPTKELVHDTRAPQNASQRQSLDDLVAATESLGGRRQTWRYTWTPAMLRKAGDKFDLTARLYRRAKPFGNPRVFTIHTVSLPGMLGGPQRS